MSAVSTILLLLVAFAMVFCEAAFDVLRRLLGAQIDLLPVLMVYTGLFTGTTTVAALGLFSGLCFDALSANPLGVSVLPLFLIGFLVHLNREWILRDEPFAQMVLGLMASALAPALTLLLMLSMGATPLVGWASLWQWAVMSVGGALAAPILFRVLAGLDRALTYRRVMHSPFRPDREIRRGRL